VFPQEVHRSRHYISTFLRRRGFVFREASAWHREHRRWLESLTHGQKLAPEDRAVFGEYLALLDYKISRRDDLGEQIAEIAFSPSYRGVVERLCCFRGIHTLGAMTLVRPPKEPRPSVPCDTTGSTARPANGCFRD
jgi:hypothetical protein